MDHRTKSISISQLHAAVKTAVGAAQREFPAVQLPDQHAIAYVPYWICGIPVPWPIWEWEDDQAGFSAAFARNLRNDARIAGLGEGVGNLEPALYSQGGQSFIGVRPGAATLTE
jgi:hypothetical protein